MPVLAIVITCATYTFYNPILQPFLLDKVKRMALTNLAHCSTLPQFNYNSMMVAVIFLIGPGFYVLVSFVAGPIVDKFVSEFQITSAAQVTIQLRISGP